MLKAWKPGAMLIHVNKVLAFKEVNNNNNNSHCCIENAMLNVSLSPTRCSDPSKSGKEAKAKHMMG